ncbi:MAG TPA: hypothetical protein VFF70_03065, partial [Anaerolineae bacterium]|nr:hypothetical protein [Anaerolineae bacterium]
MSAKNPAFEKLAKILKLEVDTGYRDRAMVGGLSNFAARWKQEAGNDAISQQVAEQLSSYGQI